MKDKIEYIYSVAVYQKYLTRLGEMIISSPRFCGKAASCLCRLLVKRTPLKHGYLHWPNKVEMALNTIQSINQSFNQNMKCILLLVVICASLQQSRATFRVYFISLWLIRGNICRKRERFAKITSAIRHELFSRTFPF